MIRKNFLFRVQQIGCALLFVVAIMAISTTSLKSQVITSFPESDFLVVDHTKIHPTITGYEYVVEAGPAYRKYFKLIDTVEAKISLRSKHSVDFNKEFFIDFRIFTDLKLPYNNLEAVAETQEVENNFAFVLSSDNDYIIDLHTLNYANMDKSLWCCCFVYWKINRNFDGSPKYYELLIFMEDNSTGKIVLFSAKRFDKLSEFITGLTPTNSLINFGVIASGSNRKAVEFVKLINDENIPTIIKEGKIYIETSCGLIEIQEEGK